MACSDLARHGKVRAVHVRPTQPCAPPPIISSCPHHFVPSPAPAISCFYCCFTLLQNPSILPSQTSLFTDSLCIVIHVSLRVRCDPSSSFFSALDTCAAPVVSSTTAQGSCWMLATRMFLSRRISSQLLLQPSEDFRIRRCFVSFLPVVLDTAPFPETRQLLPPPYQSVRIYGRCSILF